ncbi:MAG: hypothetical protein NTY33_00750 [Candidatus Moranbacteria bacterium]|nr:hypothetical protein [Candidatus Moranbacteria bacterium]
MADPVNTDPDVVDAVYATKKSFWQRWLPVIIAVAVVLLFIGYLLLAAHKAERAGGRSTEVRTTSLSTALPKPAATIDSQKKTGPEVQLPVVKDVDLKKIEPVKRNASDEDAEDEAWLNGEDGSDQADEAWLNGND